MDHGLRERKKARTRRAIATEALRLFAERGYEETTIADIAAAADISPRTFFSYFPAKEDVVFADMDDKLMALRERLAERPEDEIPLVTMRRLAFEILEAMAADYGLYGPVTVALIMERPALQARALKRMWDMELEIAEELRMIPELDETTIAIVCGVLMGGIRAISIHCQQFAQTPEEIHKAVEQTLAVIEHGLSSVPALTRPVV